MGSLEGSVGATIARWRVVGVVVGRGLTMHRPLDGFTFTSIRTHLEIGGRKLY